VAGSPNPPVGQGLTSNRFDPKPAIGQQTLTYGINAKETPAAFQNAYIAGNSSTVDPATLHRTYYITTRDPNGNPIRQLIPGLIDFANPGGRADDPQIFYVRYADMDVPFNFAYTNAAGQLVSQTYTWRQFFEKRFSTKPFRLMWRVSTTRSTTRGRSPSSASGRAVTIPAWTARTAPTSRSPTRRRGSTWS
jgi:hypothetical protein